MMHLYSAGSAGPLSERLAEVLSVTPADPMTPEWLAVPSDGMRRWLTLQLARHLGRSGPGYTDGVAANIQRALPGDLRQAVLAVDRPEDEPDPWRIQRLVWSVLGVMVTGSGEPELVEGGTGGPSAYATARRIADLFDRYHLHRPEMIRQWSIGRDVDGSGRPLTDHAVWQARLWRQVRDAVGEPSPPERLPGVLERLHRGEALLDLPERLVFFGFTLLPAGDFLDVTRAVAARHDVHVFLLEPTRLHPDALLRSSPTPADGTARLRAGDPTAELVDQPLLRSWGRLHRETALLLADAGSEGLHSHRVDAPVSPGSPTTLLGRLQHDISTNAPPLATLIPESSDTSVQFHACFGDTRQVEVLRDAVLHLLADPGSTITEDDIVVLCPALDRFAPLIEAVFGRPADASAPAPGGAAPGGPVPDGTKPSGWWPAGDGRGAPSLRYRIADQSLRNSNPVLGAASALLELVAGRCDTTSVLEFLAMAPVRERFGFDDDDLAVITEWAEATNVRWGLDADQRVAFDVPSSVVTNTWRAALDRLLVGSAIGDDELQLGLGGIAPFGVEGSDVEVLGRLAEAVGLLQALAGTLSESRPIAAWVERFRRACTGLLAASPETAWQMEALERILSEAVEASGPAGAPSGVDLAFSDARRVLDERLDDKVGRADFFRGGITVTSMTPLRWVPFRVVCLLGMDQTAFGSEGSAGDDLTATPPRIGDRDPRGEARESLLEAVLAAGEHLVVVRDGRDVKTNQVVPRAVVTAELFEAVLSVVDPGLRPAVADRLEIDHPRQPFDERCFEVGRLVAGKAWGFDGGELDGALARRRQAVVRPPFLDTPLGPVDTDVIDLADLQRFFNDPVASFFSQRLQARLPREEDELPTILPMGTDGLHGWKIGTRLLEARVAGHTFDQWLRHERATGSLPPGPLGDASVTALGDNVEQLVEAARQSGLESGPGQSVPVDAELPDGTRVVGSVRLRRPSDEPGPVRLFYSRAKATHRVAAWLDLMALLATDPGRPWRSVAVSRAAGPKGGAEVVDLKAGPELVGRAEAAKVLAVAADLYRRGLCEPIPLFPNFSYALYSGYKVSEQWRGYKFPADGDRPAAKLAFGDRDLAAMKAMPALPTDPEGRHPRVMRYATYLYRTISQSTTSGPSATGSRSNTSGARR